MEPFEYAFNILFEKMVWQGAQNTKKVVFDGRPGDAGVVKRRGVSDHEPRRERHE
jgi:hypothetical protein